MNQENLEYLKARLFFTGFEDRLDAKLENNIRNGVSYFELPFCTEFQGGRMHYNLHFKRGDQNEMYFFNKYDAALTKPDGRDLLQTFYLENGRGITMKEAYNLLDGRAVNKDFEKGEGKKYNAWVKLDFENKTEGGNFRMHQFHENYGYDLEKIIEKLPLKELSNESVTEALFYSLRKGNLQVVTWIDGDNTVRRFIAADPENRGLRVYDQQMKEITTEIRNCQQRNVNAGELMKKRTGTGKGLSV